MAVRRRRPGAAPKPTRAEASARRRQEACAAKIAVTHTAVERVVVTLDYARSVVAKLPPELPPAAERDIDSMASQIRAYCTRLLTLSVLTPARRPTTKRSTDGSLADPLR